MSQLLASIPGQIHQGLFPINTGLMDWHDYGLEFRLSKSPCVPSSPLALFLLDSIFSSFVSFVSVSQRARDNVFVCLFCCILFYFTWLLVLSILMQIIQYPSFWDHTDMCFEPTLTQNSKPIVERDANANYPDLILTRYIHVHSHHPERIKTHN